VTARRRARGFTLLEVGVAMAILAAGVVTCLQIFTGSLRLQERSSRQLRVALAARSAMDSLFAAQELEPKCDEKPPSAEGFVVSYCIAEAGPADGILVPSDTKPDEPPLVLTVNVAWQDAGGAKTYTLRSMRLAPEKNAADVGLDR
jgi:prepilin-type N-terminal cleavage/methylation domain-containing protein